jgi:hypothetical protein
MRGRPPRALSRIGSEPFLSGLLRGRDLAPLAGAPTGGCANRRRLCNSLQTNHYFKSGPPTVRVWRAWCCRE